MLALVIVSMASMLVLAKAQPSSRIQTAAAGGKSRIVAASGILLFLGLAAIGAGIGFVFAYPALRECLNLRGIDVKKDWLADAAPIFRSIAPTERGKFYAPMQFCSPAERLYPDYDKFKTMWGEEKKTHSGDESFTGSPMYQIYEAAAKKQSAYVRLLAVVYGTIIEKAKEAKVDKSTSEAALRTVVATALDAVPAAFSGKKNTLPRKTSNKYLKLVCDNIKKPEPCLAARGEAIGGEATQAKASDDKPKN